MKDLGTKRLETKRLILRRVTKEDVPSAYAHWCNSDVVDRYVMWSKHKSIDETFLFYQTWIDEYDDPTTYRWIVELKENSEVIGTITVPSKKFIKFGTYEIGYCYGDAYWGKGYATEALMRVIKYLFEEVKVETIYAEYMSNNPASRQVMKKARMQFEGIKRSRLNDKNNKRNDLGSYSITKEEYFNN